MPITPILAVRPRVRGLPLPIGGGYYDILEGFAEAVFGRPRGAPVCGPVRVVVLPTAYSADPRGITDAERSRNLAVAEARRREIEAACLRVAPGGVTYRGTVAPIFHACRCM